MIKKINGFMRKKEISLIEWIVWGILFIVLFYSFFYADTIAIVQYEVNFWGTIFKGNGWRDYYEYTLYLLSNVRGGPAATYDYLMYIILGLWGLPIWIFMESKGIYFMDSNLAKMYGKSIYLVALFFVCFLIYKICRQIKITEQFARWASFLFASSILTFVALGHYGQTDIIGLIFILTGLYYFLRKENIKMLLFFSIAVTFKMYAFFLFVPILLLREKNILKIGLSCIAVILTKVLCALPFGQTPAIQMKKEFESDMLERLTENKLPLMNGSMPTVLLLIALICVFCYLHKEITEEDSFYKHTIYVCLLSMASLFISFDSSAYWYLHMAPYLVILLVYNTENYREAFLLETGALACLTLANLGSRLDIFEIYYCKGMLLSWIFDELYSLENAYMLADFCRDIPITKYSGALFCGYVALMLGFLWKNRPGQIKHTEEVCIRPYAWLRLGINVAICYIPMMLYVYSSKILN